MANSAVSLTALPTGAVYDRPFLGYYLYAIQQIGHSPFQAVIKYDVYDPNTKVTGSEVGLPASEGIPTGAADIQFSTWGIGLNYQVDQQMRWTVYYDLVRNEVSPWLATGSTLSDLSHDRNDNVLTIRCQYKF